MPLVDIEDQAYDSITMETIYKCILEEKGLDIIVLDISHKTNWMKKMLVCTAMSARHCLALANAVQFELKRAELVKNPKIDRNEGDEWIILTAGSNVVEIMTEEQRTHMDIERLWVLKKTVQETMNNDEDELRFMYDEEDDAALFEDDEEVKQLSRKKKKLQQGGRRTRSLASELLK